VPPAATWGGAVCASGMAVHRLRANRLLLPALPNLSSTTWRRLGRYTPASAAGTSPHGTWRGGGNPSGRRTATQLNTPSRPRYPNLVTGPHTGWWDIPRCRNAHA